mmetsp:Transcript_14370/g.33457  ORF Transcript_14370/g.33457 Transcript_14370/m.33457 type:complete len:96 (-) Transcript_14370:453-740(-)
MSLEIGFFYLCIHVDAVIDSSSKKYSNKLRTKLSFHLTMSFLLFLIISNLFLNRLPVPELSLSEFAYPQHMLGIPIKEKRSSTRTAPHVTQAVKT